MDDSYRHTFPVPSGSVVIDHRDHLNGRASLAITLHSPVQNRSQGRGPGTINKTAPNPSKPTRGSHEPRL